MSDAVVLVICFVDTVMFSFMGDAFVNAFRCADVLALSCTLVILFSFVGAILFSFDDAVVVNVFRCPEFLALSCTWEQCVEFCVY